MTKTKDIYLAGGCFWGTEHYFKQIEGVVDTEVGFANGHTQNPTYQEVYTDTTGFVEAVRIQYNPDVVGLDFLLQMFFKVIDPTSLNRQEPGTDEEIAEFCRINHGVTFPLMKKGDVFGENAHPIFKYLTEQVPTEEVKGLKNKATMKLVDSLSRSEGRKEGEIRWNFTKFLISKDGTVIKRFPPVATPEDMEPEIEAMLK